MAGRFVFPHISETVKCQTKDLAKPIENTVEGMMVKDRRRKRGRRGRRGRRGTGRRIMRARPATGRE
jgi:hypothetical protein